MLTNSNDIGKLKGRTESGKFLWTRKSGGPSSINSLWRKNIHTAHSWRLHFSTWVVEPVTVFPFSSMANKCILQIALLMSFSTTALSMSYDVLRYQQRSSNLACQKLLEQLPGTPQYCLEDRMNFEVPEEIMQPPQFQKEDAVLIIHEMLQQIFGILRRNFSSTGWNETVIKTILVELDGQMDDLETILEEIMEEENFPRGDMTILHLKKYYLSILQYLKSKEYRSCAWTVVQVEILRNFSFLNRLTDYLRNWTSPPCGSGNWPCWQWCQALQAGEALSVTDRQCTEFEWTVKDF